jgi:hypothetical protein
MFNINTFLSIFIPGELIAFFLFKFIGFSLEKKWELKVNRAVIKGILERLFLFIALIYHIPQALIAFGALKIATRFIEDKEIKISLDYFFIGNITSLIISLIYFALWKSIINS